MEWVIYLPQKVDCFWLWLLLLRPCQLHWVTTTDDILARTGPASWPFPVTSTLIGRAGVAISFSKCQRVRTILGGLRRHGSGLASPKVGFSSRDRNSTEQGRRGGPESLDQRNKLKMKEKWKRLPVECEGKSLSWIAQIVFPAKLGYGCRGDRWPHAATIPIQIRMLLPNWSPLLHRD